MAHAGTEEVAKPRFESPPGMEHELREDRVQSQRLSWLQAYEGSKKFLRPKGFRDTVTLWCWNLPQVGQFLVDQPGGLAIPGPVCHFLHKLRSNGICRDVALAQGAPRPASKFVDGSPRLVARAQEIDGVDSFLSLLLGCCRHSIGERRSKW